jgi:ABC-type phosphate transport system substrate-binding protein
MRVVARRPALRVERTGGLALARAARAVMWLGLSVLAVEPACSRERTSGLTLAGSTSIQPFAEKWADAYRATHPGTTIHIQGGGSTAGIQAVESGTAHIGMSSRELLPDEAIKLRGIVVARDGIAVVLNPKNCLFDMKLHEVRKIYAGEITRWADLGGADRKITVITREEGSGTRGAFEELVMNGRRITSSALVQADGRERPGVDRLHLARPRRHLGEAAPHRGCPAHRSGHRRRAIPPRAPLSLRRQRRGDQRCQRR